MTIRALTSLLAILAAPAVAQEQIQHGCYQRVYSKAHLAQNPDQGVAALRMLIGPAPEINADFAYIAATMADQGQGRRDGVAGLVLESGYTCDGLFCWADGDAGSFNVTRQSSEGLTFEGGGALGDWEIDELPSSNLQEGNGKPSYYRLDKVSDSVCADME